MKLTRIPYILIFCIILSFIGFSGPGVCQDQPNDNPTQEVNTEQDNQTKTRESEQESAEPTVVDFKANIMTPIKIGDSSALNLIGNVMFFHNGAIITCDSAIRYNDKRMECFNNVLINQNDTYIYGDRADYNGEINIAQIYAPIIKIVDKDITMYTYNFSFNTLDKIGYYYDGATISQEESLLESSKGYYLSDQRTVICVDSVQIKNPDYQLKSDSVDYNMDTEYAKFFVPSWIWTTEGEILSADQGAYNKLNAVYHFYRNSYVLTEEQELWADSIDYFSQTENVVMKKNIQVTDTVNKVLVFGDFGQYWGKEENLVLTDNPSLINYEENQDSIFMRADSVFIFTVNEQLALEMLTQSNESQGDQVAIDYYYEEEELLEEETTEEVSNDKADSEAEAEAGLDQADDFEPEGDSNDTRDAGSPPGVEVIEQTLEEPIEQPSEIELEQMLDDGGQRVLTKKEQRQLKAKQKQLDKEAKQLAKKQLKNKLLESIESDELNAQADSLSLDSLAVLADSMALDSLEAQNRLKLRESNMDGDSIAKDSVFRVLKAYNNVKMFRTDFQAVCDSLVGFSIDSTLRMYMDPVLWNEENQIKSDIVNIYTKGNQIDKAIFSGQPIMISKVDSLRYNQVRGKVLENYFTDNEIRRTDVNANAQTLYYMTEENEDDKGKPFIVGFLVANCANITFLIEDRQIESITYKGNPEYTIYPLTKIPIDQPQFFDNFAWEIDRKPTKEEIFDRHINLSQRTEYEDLEKPLFPITEEITSYVRGIIERGEWIDRNDVLSEGALNFMRSLGYEKTTTEDNNP